MAPTLPSPARERWPVAYRELDHTADLEIELEARSLAELLARAVIVLAELLADEAPVDPEPVRRRFECAAPDDATRLRALLACVLLRADADGWVALEASTLDDGAASGVVVVEATGARAPVGSRRRDIKAVTYHHLAIEACDGGLRARVVFDI